MYNIQPQYTYAVVMHTGAVLWLPTDRAIHLKKVLESNECPKSLDINNQWITVSSIAGLYTAQEMRAIARRKAGEWQCEYQTWHPKGDKECGCKAEAMRKHQQALKEKEEQEYEEAIANQTPEERARVKAKLAAIRESLGILKESKGIK